MHDEKTWRPHWIKCLLYSAQGTHYANMYIAAASLFFCMPSSKFSKFFHVLVSVSYQQKKCGVWVKFLCQTLLYGTYHESVIRQPKEWHTKHAKHVSTSILTKPSSMFALSGNLSEIICFLSLLNSVLFSLNFTWQTKTGKEKTAS